MCRPGVVQATKQGEYKQMTQQIDPRALAEAVRSLKAEIKAEMREEERPVGEPLRQTAADWTRIELDAPKGSPLARGAHKTARVHLKIILDLDFEFDSPWSQPEADTGRPTCRMGDVPGNRITTAMAKAFMRKLQLQPKRVRVKDPAGGKVLVEQATNKPTSPAYRNRIMSTLMSLLRFRYQEDTPLRRWRTERSRKRTGCFQGEGQMRAFMEHTPPWFQKVAWLAVDRGCMRLSEVLYLEHSEVDLDNGRIVLPAHRVKMGRFKGKGRSFPISTANQEMLRAQVAASTSKVYVFAKPNGKPYSKSHVGRIMKAAARLSGLRLGKDNAPPTFHYFRRTALMWRLMKDRFTPGGNPAGGMLAAQEEGGWDDLKVMSGYMDETEAMVAESARMADVSVDEVMAARMAELKAAAAMRPQAAPATATTAVGQRVRRSPRSTG